MSYGLIATPGAGAGAAPVVGPNLLDIWNRLRKLQPGKILAREVGIQPGARLEVVTPQVPAPAGLLGGLPSWAPLAAGALILFFVLSRRKR